MASNIGIGAAQQTIDRIAAHFGDSPFTVDDVVAAISAYMPSLPTIRNHLQLGIRARIVEPAGFRLTGERGRPAKVYRVRPVADPAAATFGQDSLEAV